MFELLSKGGILMVPIMFCSVIALTVFVERMMRLRRAQIDTGELMLKIRDLVRQGQISLAIFTCEKTKAPVAKILLAGLKASHMGKETAQEAMQEAGLQEIPKIERYLGVLSTVANVTPLLGLLGTVTGMIQAFTVIQAKGVGQAAELAGGISQALITTAAGLTIAIPALVMYNYLSTRVDNQVQEIERASVELVNLLFHRDETSAREDAMGVAVAGVRAR